MPLPASKSRLRRLGRALASGEASLDDEKLYRSFMRCCDDALNEAFDLLSSAGFDVVPRVKTRDTLVDKLKRRPDIPLPRIDDVAGCRLVVDGDRDEQDMVVERVEQTLRVRPDCSTTIRDRRRAPSYGYRAVHVLLEIDEIRVEIQVRTALQHLWAEVSEKMADHWGRAVRYGATPDGARERAIFDHLQTASDNINELEDIQVALNRAQTAVHEQPDSIPQDIVVKVETLQDKVAARKLRLESGLIEMLDIIDA